MKNKKDFWIFVSILAFVFGSMFFREVNNLDEIWNFNFANCIANGLIPYKDFNIIVGPLVPLICAIILKTVAQEMIVMRIIAVIFNSIVLYLIYKIMGKLEIKEYLKLLILLILAYLMKEYFTIDYNLVTLLITCIIIYLDINEKKENFKRHFFIGLISGLTVLTKQTSGIIIVIATIGYKIFEIKNKKDLIKFIKLAFIRLMGALILPAIMLIILIKLGAINAYFDYCILGIKTFSNKISYINRLIRNNNIVIRIFSLLPIGIYISLLYLYFKERKKEILIILIFSIVQMILVYPISDESHFVVAIPPAIIGLSYILNYILNKISISIKVEFICYSILEGFIICIVLITFSTGIYKYKSQNINTELKHFKYLPMSKQTIEGIEEIEKYINSKEKNIYILDATAALYMIPINKYNKNYDLFLKGNLGSKGEFGQIENLEKEENKIILIMNDKYNRNWQNPENVRAYVKSKMVKTGEIEIFDIYE